MTPAVVLLELKAIAVTYAGKNGSGPVEVVHGIDLSVRPGQLVCVAGRSGSGKSTLLNVAAGLTAPTTGEVCWAESPTAVMTESQRAARRRSFIGYVFQSAGLIGSLTAGENVALPGMVGGDARLAAARVRDLIAQVGLPADRAHHFPSQLSGGEQQRVGIARALYADPPLLIVDEPTANLDRATADAIIALLVGLRMADRGLLIASHDPHLVERADLVVRLE